MRPRRRCAATGEPLVVSDLQITYLGFGRVGPVRTRATVLRAPRSAAARIEVVDHGAEYRLMTSASAVALRGLRAVMLGAGGGHDVRDYARRDARDG